MRRPARKSPLGTSLRASSTAATEKSSPIASAPRSNAPAASMPGPQHISSTRVPRVTRAASSMAPTVWRATAPKAEIVTADIGVPAR